MKISLVFSLIVVSNIALFCHAQEDDDDDLLPDDTDFEAIHATIKASRRRFSKHRKNRAKEELAKAITNACEPDFVLWPDSPEAKYDCPPLFCGGCEHPHTQENKILGVRVSCSIPDIPPCKGPDRYMYVPPHNFLSPLIPPQYKFAIDFFIGKNAQPACRAPCSGYQSFWCFGAGGLPFCTTDAKDCGQLNWDQYTAVIGFIANFIPASKVFKIMNKAKGMSKTARAAFISAQLRNVAKKQLTKLRTQAMRNLKREIKGIAEDIKDDLLNVAMEEMLLEEAQIEDPGFDWEDAEEILRAVDVVGIFDLMDSFWKQECSIFEPEEIAENEPARCADTRGAQNSHLGVEAYWDSHPWENLCSPSKTQWRKLGWNKKKWDGPVVGYPRSDWYRWDDLRATQRTAAMKLGYRKKIWNDAYTSFEITVANFDESGEAVSDEL